MDPTGAPVGAVVLTGGTGMRLGGADKASLEVDGQTLLERALQATSRLQTVVVGDPVPTSRIVRWAREDPPGGGPAAGLLAGLDRLAPEVEVVVALAVDMPLVTGGTVGRVLAALTAGSSYDGAVLVDVAGRRQPLCAAYRRRALVAARPPSHDLEHGLPLRDLVGGLVLAEVPAIGDEALDVDTAEDLRRLQSG